MSTEKKQGTWVQCQHCGYVYHIKEKVPIERLYVVSDCPGCGEYTKGLNCGSEKEDIYELMDISMDPRYYKY